MLRKLWADEAGFIICTELVLVVTIVVIGMICGLVTIRNQVVQELIDVGQAIGWLDQSYSFSGLISSHGGCICPGSAYKDLPDFCQNTTQTPFGWAGGITILPPTGEDP